MKYSIVNYQNHNKEYFSIIDPIETKNIVRDRKIIHNYGNGKIEKYMIYQAQKHPYIKDLIIVYVEPCKDIELQKIYRKSILDQKFYDFNLEDHIRGCMGLAMEFVDHDSVEYYKKIHKIQENNDIENLLIKAMFLRYSKKEKIWIFAAIGETNTIKKMIDGRI